MKLHQLPGDLLRERLAGPGLWLRTGPFSLRIHSRTEAIAAGLAELYAQFETRDARETFADFHVRVDAPNRWRRHFRRSVQFEFDGYTPFMPLPAEQAYPLLEWGLNWCVATQAHHFLMIHAAVVEKNGRVAILPAPPGSGKSTLTAGLVLSGWRLLSDETTLVDRQSGLIMPLPRPVSLKNQSIPLIRQFSSEAFVNRATPATAKGTVAHLRPPRESVRRQHEAGRPAWVIFPKWEAGATTTFTPRSRAQTLMFLAENAFNYSQLGQAGFELAARLIGQVECYDFRYSDLAEAVAAFDRLAGDAR